VEEETNEMIDENGYPTTLKLLRILERHAEGEDVTKELVAFAKKGYYAAEETVIHLAESGHGDAKTSLSSMLILDKNHFQPNQTQRAYLCCDLEPNIKKKLLQKKANAGEEWALAPLKEIDPTSKKHIDLLGSIVEDTILQNLGGKDSLWTHHITREDILALENELLSEGRSPLERLLVRRVALCYLALHYFESLYFQTLDRPINPRQHSILLQRMHQANERYLAAVRTLAQIRKMKLPNLQVNIGEKQINVA
jgi:hypothetical protein